MGANGTATADGNVYLASTSDNPYIEGPRNQVYLTIPKEGFKFVHTPLHIQDPPGHYFDVGSDRGMNEKGFSWTRAVGRAERAPGGEQDVCGGLVPEDGLHRRDGR